MSLTLLHKTANSNFGSFITINDDEDVPDEMLATIIRLASEFTLYLHPLSISRR